MNDDNDNDNDGTEGGLDKTSVVASETLKLRIQEAGESPPALVLLMGPARHVGRQWLLTESNMKLGRAAESHIFVDDRSVSKTHGEVTLDSDGVHFADFNSTNGTEINGEKANSNTKYKLRNNDQLKAGNVIFKYLERGSLETVSHRDTFDRTQLDPLTQIYNKGALNAAGEETFRRALANQFPLTVIVFDLDNFKNVNDTYGHQAGDYVLREMSSLIKNQLIRSEDFFARFGGEEFCLLLTGSPLQRGVEVAERIRKTVEKYEFKYNDERMPVTVSIGVACIEADMQDWTDLFEKADQASYLSKKGGKNRVSTI